MKRSYRLLPALLALIVLTSWVYHPALRYDFVHYDDVENVADEPHIRAGISLEGIRWAFSAPHAILYIPLTWISFMADVSWHGTEPGGFHLTNILIHLANVVLLLLVLLRYTGALWPSVLTAGVFAVHPLGVETVAWIYERKGLLSAFFFLWTLLAYAWYVRKPSPGRYLAVTACFILSLLCKQSAVSLPVLLLLLDWWPLARLRTPGPRRFFLLALEKVPLFLLSGVFSIVLLMVFQEDEYLVTYASLGGQAANSLVSYMLYVWKIALPRGLAAPYVLPLGGHPWWKTALAGAVMAAASLGAVVAAPRRPYLTAGWIWFVAVMFPTISLLNTGYQAMADRYAYLPLVGLAVGAIWWTADAYGGEERRRWLMPAAGAALILLLAGAAARQLPAWRNAEALFGRTLRVTRDNWVAANNLGSALAEAGKKEAALMLYRESLRIAPSYGEARVNLANILIGLGRWDEAIEATERALAVKPKTPNLRHRLAAALAKAGRTSDAVEQYRLELAQHPGNAAARFNLGVGLLILGEEMESLGRAKEAAEHYRQALALDSNNFEARRRLQNLPLGP